jgi:hypothetical protein
MSRAYAIFTVVLSLCFACAAQQAQPASPEMNSHKEMSHEHEMTPSGPVTYADLETTAAQLEKARRATEKYHDVREAEADGFQAIGPDVPGMGIHYVHLRRNHPSGASVSGFDVEHPDILLYEKDTASPGGYALVGVSYLFNAETDSDGQPKNPPFPKSLASWHRHSDLCVFPDRSVKSRMNQEQCKAEGGRFTALTQWMVHAWIWKDSPAGVFSPKNPNVQ